MKLLSVRVVKHMIGFPRGAVGCRPLEIDKPPPNQQPALVVEGDRTNWFPDIPSNL